MKKTLAKSSKSKKFLGVIGGIGEYFNLDENIITLLRLLYIALVFFSFGFALFMYFAAAFVLPKDSDIQTPTDSEPIQMKNADTSDIKDSNYPDKM